MISYTVRHDCRRVETFTGCPKADARWPWFLKPIRSAARLGNRQRQATETSIDAALPLEEILQECITAHFLTEELGPVPHVVSESWGHACKARLQEAHRPVTLQYLDNSSGRFEDCQVTLVGVFHRDAVNLRIVRDAIDAAAPDALALEARPSFLSSCAHLAAPLPDDLTQKLFETPLQGLQEALDHISLEDRLAWHELLLRANEQLSIMLTHGSSPAATSAAAAHPQPSPSSALTPTKVVSAFLSRELALSEKVAAVRVAQDRGLPLYGIELDDTAPYLGLLQGPLTAAAQSGLGEPLESQQRRLALASLEPAVAAAFQDWFRSVPPSDFSRVLQQQLAGLMPQCLSPESYLSYADETDALWSDERRVGRVAAAQHGQLTAMREEHFLEQLRRVAAGGAAGGLPCRRLVAVMGRAHAARLRRALLRQQRERE
ncbi:hypothetical protein PLESTB_001781300 [Pleodorina starrii]|uniref:Uncharacterized protein n=1 Tax=Pleodorina starrii TaxID=330485 RepID=A0A9W6C1A5_9CHLO|nr:hypothetical protein PLESTM_000803700 [Pleodorina starrii]GLC61600.1 hypothetical protein PLESTB_001781300 [Pleodorina starrii]GLC70220.1 hypothetical protein PLESTF_000939900 [Pleodorina starrii]